MSGVSTVSAKREPTLEEKKIYLAWKKMIEEKGTEEWNISEEEKAQLSCNESISWEEVKKQYGLG